MPLIHGYSPAALHRNVGTLVAEGRDPAQAAAIAYKEARAAWRKKHPRGGYPAHLAGTGRHVRNRAGQKYRTVVCEHCGKRDLWTESRFKMRGKEWAALRCPDCGKLTYVPETKHGFFMQPISSKHGKHNHTGNNRSADVSILPFAFDVGDHVQHTQTGRFGQVTRRARNAQGWRQYRVRWHDDGRSSVEEESWLQPFRARMVRPKANPNHVHCNRRGCHCALPHTRIA